MHRGEDQPIVKDSVEESVENLMYAIQSFYLILHLVRAKSKELNELELDLLIHTSSTGTKEIWLVIEYR